MTIRPLSNPLNENQNQKFESISAASGKKGNSILNPSATQLHNF
jgi:hypothetical protein